MMVIVANFHLQVIGVHLENQAIILCWSRESRDLGHDFCLTSLFHLPSINSIGTNSPTAEPTIQDNMCKDNPPSKSTRYYLRWGSLRFGFHGIWAILTFIVTTICIVWGNDFYLWPSMIGNQVLGLHAYSLLDQVPLSTKICRGFVAPHREAFKRTIAMIHYTNLRLAQPWLPSALYYPLLALSWWQFVPLDSDFRNGNTWIFVVPMFFGVSLDMTQSLLMEHYCGLSSLVSWRWLLGVHMSAMSMAFAFTLAFRGIISIQRIYFGAAFFVALLFLAGSGLIFSSVGTDICSLGVIS
jgi:hypothetical protein